MITRSKAKVLNAQAELNAPNRAPTSVVRTRMPQARQPGQLHASRLDQDQQQQQQQQHAELKAALLAAAIQMASNLNQTGARVDQDPTNDAAFDAAALETQATIAACLDLMRTSCKIAVQVLMITLMACQANNAVHRKVASVSSYITAIRHSFWPGLLAVTIFVVFLHLFDVLCVRRVLTRASMGERVTASAAIFLGVAERLRERLRWMLIVQLW
jgi:hypothetical protein